MNIVLIGMPASGKSTVGVILAKVLGMDFVDTDLLIQKKTGEKLKDTIEHRGVDGFLKVEEDVCAQVEVTNSVIATGGSVVYSEKAMKHLKDIGTVLYLQIDFDTLLSRLRDVKQRGVVLKEGQTISDLFEERCALYEKYADLTIPEGHKSLETVVEVAEDKLRSLMGTSAGGQ